MSRVGFEVAMEHLRNSASNSRAHDHAPAMLLLNKLFDLFYPDETDSVDFVELCTGLSVLCGGDREEKVHAAFRLFGTTLFIVQLVARACCCCCCCCRCYSVRAQVP